MKRLLALALLMPLAAQADSSAAVSTEHMQITAKYQEVTLAYKYATDGTVYLTYGTGVLLHKYKVLVLHGIPEGSKRYWRGESDTYVFGSIGTGIQYPIVKGVYIYLEGNYRVISNGSDGMEYTSGFRFKF